MDEQDTRSVSFLHLLSVLKTAETPPSYLFLENVQGFDGSQAHRRLLEVGAESDVRRVAVWLSGLGDFSFSSFISVIFTPCSKHVIFPTSLHHVGTASPSRCKKYVYTMTAPR